MDFDDSFSQEIGTNFPDPEMELPSNVERLLANTPYVILSDTKENSEVGSYSESCSHDVLLNKVVNELKELTTKVAEMDSSNNKMFEIMIGLLKLDIKSTNATDNDMRPTQNKTVDHEAANLPAKFTTLNTKENVVNVTNNFKTPDMCKQPFMNDISTVFISYNDERIDPDSLSNVVRPYEHQMHYNKPKSTYKGPTTLVFDSEAGGKNAAEINRSRFLTGSCSYKRTKEDINDPTMCTKKLNFPSPTPNSSKRRRCDTPIPGSNRKRIAPSPKTNIAASTKPLRKFRLRPNMATLPKSMKCRFRPTVDMRLQEDQAKLFGYIFREEHDNNDEDVVAIGNDFVGKRSDFQHLVPGGYVGMPLISMMVRKLTWNQANAGTPTFWCLPPMFAREAMMGYSADKLTEVYGGIYLPAIQNLKLIYVPMEDSCGHWFLMVVHIEKGKIFHLDSFLVDEKLDERRQQIRKIAAVLSHMMLIIYKTDMSVCLLPELENWEIVEPRGIPNCGNSENSGLWVAEWFNMEDSFNEQMIGVLDDRTVRIKMTLRLLMGPHNALRRVVEKRASDYFDMHVDDTA